MAHSQPFMGTKLEPRQGLSAGLSAGVAMIILWALFAELFGPGAAALINTIAATLLGSTALGESWQPLSLVVGLLIHLVLCLLLGELFAVSLDRLSRRDTLVVATFYGFTIWFVSSFIVAGWFNEMILGFSRTWWGLLAHFAFGLLLGIYAVRYGASPPVLSPD